MKWQEYYDRNKFYLGFLAGFLTGWVLMGAFIVVAFYSTTI